MKSFSVFTKVLVLLLLLLAAAGSFLLINDEDLALVMTVFFLVLFLALIIYFAFFESLGNKRAKKIIATTKSVSAKILSVRQVGGKNIILQLLIKNLNKDYIAGLVIHNPNDDQMHQYKSGKIIVVHANRDNPQEIFIPEPVEQKSEKSDTFWMRAFQVIIVCLMVGIPLYCGLSDVTEEEFHDIAIIWDNKGQGNIWELRFVEPKKIIIDIHDPFTGEKLETIKDKKDIDFNDPWFFICQQQQKVYVIGADDAPSIDIYDAVTFEKLSDIIIFEQTNPFLKNGIASISINREYDRINYQQRVFEITTNNGDRCYYNVPKNEFYYSEAEFKSHFRKDDSLLMSKKLFSFVLSEVPEGVNKYQLNIVKSDTTKSIDALLELEYTWELDEEDFYYHKNYDYKYCEFVSPSKTNYYLKGDIIYSDSSMAVILYETSLGTNSEKQISGISKSGKTIFILKESDFPNKEEMDEDEYWPPSNLDFICKKKNDLMVILFDKYGALCFDLTNGKMLWKYEP